jgi:site-specific DNA recombinase
MDKQTIKKPVGIWIRVSTEDQARGESPEHHEKRARYYAESKDWKIIEVYHLEGVSGKAVMAHPEAQRMLKDIKSGRISGLIFSKLARLARSTRELLDFADVFREHDADLISLQESIDTSTPAGRLFYTMIAAMAQWEREEISERVAASVPIRAKLGKSLGGQAPYGYRWENKRLVPDPTEAPIRVRLFELFAEHRRKKAVARLLNEAGYRTRNGAKFSDTTVDRLLRDPLPKGQRRSNYTKSLGDKKHWVPKPEDEWVFTEAEPIVSTDLWERCNQILGDSANNGRKPGKRPVWLFAGRTMCVCGTKMYVPSKSFKYTCPKCRNKIAVADLEEVFREQLKNFLFSPEEITRFLEQADEKIGEKKRLLESLEKEAEKVSREMKKIYQAYMEDHLSVDAFGREYRPLEQRLKQLEDEIPSMQAEIDFLKVERLSSGEVLDEARDLHARWPKLQKEEQRQIIENITDSVIVGKNDITINLSYLPTSAKKNSRRAAPLPPQVQQKGNATMPVWIRE